MVEYSYKIYTGDEPRIVVQLSMPRSRIGWMTREMQDLWGEDASENGYGTFWWLRAASGGRKTRRGMMSAEGNVDEQS